MGTGGRPGLNPRIVIGGLLIKHLCNLSDRETTEIFISSFFWVTKAEFV
jgi:hypothetical protein